MNKKSKKKASGTPTKGKGPRKSRRSVQRLIALRMGLDHGTIKAEELREACRKAGVYNAPNFKQDMKKEATLFTAIQKDGKTTGWKLTATGRELAKQAPAPPTRATPGASKKAADKPEKAADKPEKAKKPEKAVAKKTEKATTTTAASANKKASAKKKTDANTEKTNTPKAAEKKTSAKKSGRVDAKKSSGKKTNEGAPNEGAPPTPQTENVTESTPTPAAASV